MNTLLVAIGGAAGSVLRFWLSVWVVAKTGGALWGTLFVNLTGSFLMGLVAVGFREHAPARQLLMVGVLGGYTTFSAFSLQTLELLQKGESGLALANVALSVLLCLLGVWLGTLAGRAIS
jgi:fluoride exporter